MILLSCTLEQYLQLLLQQHNSSTKDVNSVTQPSDSLVLDSSSKEDLSLLAPLLTTATASISRDLSPLLATTTSRIKIITSRISCLPLLAVTGTSAHLSPSRTIISSSLEPHHSRNQQNRFTSLDSRNQNQFQNRQFQQNQQNTYSSNDFQQNRNNQFQSTSITNNFPQNQFQDSFNQQNSQNQFQTSFDRDNSRNRITLLENVQLTPSTRFQSTSGQQQTSGISFQVNRNQQSTFNQIQQSNLNQRNSESNFRSNANNRFSSGSQSQSSALFRSGSSSSEFNGEFDGVFEPLNLPSGASAIHGSISTSFSCADRPYGYYADEQNSCRVFHVCNPYLFSDGQVQTYQYSFMCGEGTIFDQNELTCKAEYEATPCQEAQNFYFRNEQFGRPEEKSF
ncbi:dr1-associated corepressor homolog [Macrobrachium rosenbergii]|uniref:dr1-associated corepressor homolog n=1 Tax=Macrobrachium rosenbergii TaxID=79674 RepID=UPI0034D53155